MNKPNYFTSGDTFDYRGRSFTVHVNHDECMGAPWDEHDGHGPVRKSRQRDVYRCVKGPGERELWHERGDWLFYDWAEAIKIAKRDGWGMSREDQIKFAWKHWRCPTKGEIAASAVERDFDYLRRWANDQWHWVYVTVECDDELHGEQAESLGGLQSDDDAYIVDVAFELADQISDELDARDKDICEKMGGDKCSA